MTDTLSATTQQPASAPAEAEVECARCGKVPALCVCEGIEPREHRTALLILQHPQEQDLALGTARLAALHFKNAVVKVGLSWPSLSRLLGRNVEPQRWAILYLASTKMSALPKDREVVVLDRKGVPLQYQDDALENIEGVILIDGTWSQAKALWWRNAWMLKCARVVLNPKRPSRYGKLRREPRREGLSTIEAAAMLMARMEGRPDIETALTGTFERLLNRYRGLQGGSARSPAPQVANGG